MLSIPLNYVLVYDLLVRVPLGVQLEEFLVRELPNILFIHLSVDLRLLRAVEVYCGGRDDEEVHRR